MLKRVAIFALSFALWLAPSLANAETGTFTLRIPNELQTLDWSKATTDVEGYVLTNLMEGLVTFDSRGSEFGIRPALASSWTISPDGKTYTFKLRPGVKWSDGVPLRAADFVYSWRRLLSPVTAASYAYLLFDIEGAKDYNSGKITNPERVGVRAIDDQTLEVKLTQPLAQWIYIPTFWVTFPMRQDLVEKYGPGWASPGRMATLGPFELTYHDLNERYGFSSNPRYYGKRGNIKKFVALVVEDNAEALRLFEKGKIDFLKDIPEDEIKRRVGQRDLKFYPSLNTQYLGFSTQIYPFDNPHMRRAIAMAIDPAEIAKAIYGVKIATSFVPPPLPGSGKGALPFDPFRAKTELAATGLESGQVKFTVVLRNRGRDKIIGDIIKKQLQKNLGAEVDVQATNHSTFRMDIDLGLSPVFLNGWSADYPDPDDFLSIFLGDAGNNHFAWKNADFDQLVLSARKLSDRAKRSSLYAQAQKIILDDQAVVVPLFHSPTIALVQPRVHGLTIDPLGYLLLGGVTVDH